MKKIIYNSLALALAAVTFTSCLKDDSMVMDPAKSKGNVLEFGNTGTPTSPTGAPVFVYTPTTLDPSQATMTVKSSVRYAGAEDVAPEDITVNLAAAPEAVDKWNAAYPNAAANAKYNQLPAAAVNFPASVTIKKGTKVAEFEITIKPGVLNAAQTNVLGIKIASKTSGPGVISGNFGMVIYNLPVKSIWDGVYTYTILNNYGTIDGNIGGGFTEDDVELATVGPNLVQMTYLGRTYSGYSQYQFSGDNTTITGVVAYSGSLRASNIDQVIKVDPVKRDFTIKWTWLGRGTIETFIRKGDRK